MLADAVDAAPDLVHQRVGRARLRGRAAQDRVQIPQLDAAVEPARGQKAPIGRHGQAAHAAAEAQLALADAAIDAAKAQVESVRSRLDDSALKTPINGRVLYRLAEPGEVLPAGGKVFTVLNLTDASMTIFLPTLQAGRLRIGDEARIVLDAIPEYTIPASVSFVSPEAQFTPKEVETRTEREKLMFRVKVRINPTLLAKHGAIMKTGVPGGAYVRLGSDVAWPEQLQVRLPQ